MTAFGGDILGLYATASKQLIPLYARVVADVTKFKRGPAHILDIASGPGEPACSLAKVFPNAAIISSDVDPTMVSKAEARTRELGLTNVACSVLDMQNLMSVASESQDVVTSCLGMMYAADFEKATAEAYRVLKDGGVFIALVWEEIPTMALMGAVMTAVLGQAPPPSPIDPLSWKDKKMVDELLKATGFKFEEGHNSSGYLHFDFGPAGDDNTWKLGLIAVLKRLMDLQAEGKHGDVLKMARATFEEEARPFTDAESHVVADSKFRMVIASKPDRRGAREYLQVHHIEGVLAEAVSHVLQERPSNPVGRIASMLADN